MRKGLLFQFILMSLVMVCCVFLNIGVLTLAVKNKDMSYAHVLFSTVMLFVFAFGHRVLYELKEQKEIEEEEKYLASGEL